MRVYSILAGIGIGIVGLPCWGASDFQWTFGSSGISSYTLNSVSSTRVFDGPVGSANPTLNLIVGNRYEVTVVDSSVHPLQIVALGATAATDTVLLGMGSVVGSFESDPDVSWQDDGALSNGKITFTMTPGLAAAMRASAHTPGYRCQIHSSAMRGSFTLIGEPIADPIAERIPMGTQVVELLTVAEGFVSPLGADFQRDTSGRMFVYDQTGQVWIVENGSRLPVPLLDLSARLVAIQSGYDERGLLGFALHPLFPSVPKVYTYTSEPTGAPADFTVSMSGAPDHQNVIAEWTLDAGNTDIVDPSSRRELLRIDHPQFNHDGGSIRFGPDGYLYFGLGDGGNGDDTGDGHGTNGNGQNPNTVQGSIMRIDVDGHSSANGQYGIPPDNPFLSGPGLAEIYAYGLRNPYSFSFDPGTGFLYLGDVGQNNIEEVDKITLGGNFGWRVREGSFFFNPNGDSSGFVTNEPVVDPVPPNLIDPVAQYDHDDGSAIIGGCVYRGSAIPAMQGVYVFGDLGSRFDVPSGRLFYLEGTSQVKELQIGNPNRSLGLWLKGFAQDTHGDVYAFGSESVGPSGTTGKVVKIVPVQDSGSCTDEDADGLCDDEELTVYHTNPHLLDTDDDGVSDGMEVTFGSDPLNPNDTPALPGLGFVGSMVLAALLVTASLRRTSAEVSR